MIDFKTLIARIRRLFRLPIKNNQDFLLVISILLLKILFFNARTDQWGSLDIIFPSSAILIMLSIGFLLTPLPIRRTLLLLFDFLLSVGLFADRLFFQFYHSVITIPVLFEFTQVKGVSSSVFALLSTWDVFFFIDFLILVPYFKRLAKRQVRKPFRWLRLGSQVAVTVLICIMILTFTAQNAAATYKKIDYTGVTLDDSVLRNLGVINYHLFDAYNFLKQNNDKASILEAAPQLKTWFSQHRQTQGHNLTGVAKGKNIIMIQMEAMQNFLVGHSVNGQPVTPNLNKLMDTSMYFDNYFTQIGQGNTSDAEFMALNSLYPAPSGSNYILRSKNTFESLPWILKDAGYQGSFAFHPYTPEFWNRTRMYQSEGFDQYFNSETYFENDEIIGMGLSDESMYRQTLSQLEQFKQPYFSFLITLSGHYPYALPKEKQSLDIPQGEYSEIFENYLQTQHYADQALGTFLDQLKEKGILDNSILIIYGDHYGTGWTNEDLEKFLSVKDPLTTYNLDELNKVPLFIHLPHDQAAGVKHISGGQMDLYPTLLNLLGITNADKVYFGQDLNNVKNGFSAFRVWAPDGSFATDEVFYIASWDGVFEHGKAYNRKTGESISLDGLKTYYDKALKQLHASDLILKTNGLPELLSLNH